jgi:hypothetical protein
MNLLVISKDLCRRLSGHSIFSWQLSSYLLKNHSVRVTHLYAPKSNASKCLTPPIVHPNYRAVEMTRQAHRRSDSAYESNLICDYVPCFHSCGGLMFCSWIPTGEDHRRGVDIEQHFSTNALSTLRANGLEKWPLSTAL